MSSRFLVQPGLFIYTDRRVDFSNIPSCSHLYPLTPLIQHAFHIARHPDRRGDHRRGEWECSDLNGSGADLRGGFSESILDRSRIRPSSSPRAQQMWSEGPHPPQLGIHPSTPSRPLSWCRMELLAVTDEPPSGFGLERYTRTFSETLRRSLVEI